MAKVSYSEQDRERIREQLVTTALRLMSKQGIQHTTVEQVYRAVGISRSFFYTFFPTKEDLIVETLYYQQPRILAFAKGLAEDPSLTWQDAFHSFLHSCCYGEKNGIAILTAEEQQLLFRRLSEEGYRTFREKQRILFAKLLECFGIPANSETVSLFTNACLLAMIVRRAIPATLPLFVPEVAGQTVEFQINAIVDAMAKLREKQWSASN